MWRIITYHFLVKYIYAKVFDKYHCFSTFAVRILETKKNKVKYLINAYYSTTGKKG